MELVVIAVHVLVALVIIGLVLLQQGKGAEMGASFGSGGSQTLFGSQGGGNFLSHATAIAVTIFFCTSIGLSFIAKHKTGASPDAGIPAAELIESHNAAAAAVAEKPAAPAGDAPVVEAAPATDVPAAPQADAPVPPAPAPAPAPAQ